MKYWKGICATNERNRYGHIITEGALADVYNRQWPEIIPSFANHNHKTAIGYSSLSGLYIQPHLMYLMNCIALPEDKGELNSLVSFCKDYLESKLVGPYQKYYEELTEKLKAHIDGPVARYYTNGPFICNRGLVFRAFPKLAAKLHDGLIDIRELQPILPGIYKMGEFVIYAHNFFRRAYSRLNTLNAPFLGRLEKLTDPSLTVRVALDPDCVGLASAVREEFEYSYWGGPFFDDDLAKIKTGVTTYENDDAHRELTNIGKTEMGWYFQNGIKTFECEEVADKPETVENGEEQYYCRYVHSMLDGKDSAPVHLDGAVRVYDTGMMVKRLEVRLDHAERRTKYTKIWRVDGAISVAKWKELISHYYRDNPLVGEYFGGKDLVLMEEKQNREKAPPLSPLKKFVPYDLTADSGIQCFLRYEKPHPEKSDCDVEVLPASDYSRGEGRRLFWEVSALTLHKLLKQRQLTVNVPDAGKVEIVDFNDFVDNLPIYACKSPAVADAVVASVAEMAALWAANGDDRLLSFSLTIPYPKKTVRVSFAGHVACFEKYFKAPQFRGFPTDEAQLDDWIAAFCELEKALFPCDRDIDPFEFVKNNGVIVFDREPIPPEQIQSLGVEDGALQCALSLPNEIIEEVNAAGVTMGCAMGNVRLECSKCGADYAACPCVLFRDPDVLLIVKKCTPLGLFWTNRKA